MSNSNQMLPKILKSLDDIHAIDVKVLDVHEQTTVTDYMIIASGRSSRHVKSIAVKVMEDMKMIGLPPLHSTGIEVGEWALIDLGDFVLHIMQPESRAFYNLEELWTEHPKD